MVPFVVEHHDRKPVIKFAQHPSCECFGCLRALVDHGIALVALLVLRLLRKSVPVLNQHLAPLEVRTEIDRDEIEGGVVVLGIFRPQHAEAFLHGEVGAADENAVREFLAAGVHPPIAESPRNQQTHDDRLAASGRHLCTHSPEREERGIERQIHECGEEVSVRQLGKRMKSDGLPTCTIKLNLTLI